MGVRHAPNPVIDAERLFEGFEDLMPFRVQDILLVSSLYDSFILREDGRLNELLIGESLELNQQIPGITHVSSGAEALALARSQLRFNLIVTNLEVGDMDAAQLAREVKKAGLDVPVVVLAYDYREIKNFVARNPVTDIDRIFLWQGNVRILITIVKYVEDERNVFHDTKTMGVPVVLVVEDDIRYYSSFLPVIYTELITQSRSLISEGINVAHKLVRMRARPKILLYSNYEDAARQVMEYGEYLLGIAYHGQRNHFSHWLMARTEFALAQKLRPRKVSDFATYDDLRRDLIESIAEYRSEQSQVLIGDFNSATFKPAEAFFLRIGGGSLGGKARGLAFVRHLLHTHRVVRRFAGVQVAVPPTVVLATDVFDQFLRENNLLDFAIHSTNDAEIERRFLAASLPLSVREDLLAFLAEVRYPLAVRSSSLLEDSQYLPFTGVYETFMLGTQHPDLDMRLV